MNILKTLLLFSTALLVGACSRAEDKNVVVEQNGHKLQVQFRTAIETNAVPVLIPANVVWVIGRDYYHSEPEQPFPRVSESNDHFEVVSNTYAYAVLDDHTTNTLCTSSVKLGTLERKSKTVISTTTNAISSEIFTPANPCR